MHRPLGELFHGVEVVVQELRGGSIDDLSRPPAQGVVLEAHGYRWTGHPCELVSCIPYIAVEAIGREVAIGIVRQHGRLVLCQFVRRIVRGRTHGVGKRGPGPAPTHANAITGGVV